MAREIPTDEYLFSQWVSP